MAHTDLNMDNQWLPFTPNRTFRQEIEMENLALIAQVQSYTAIALGLIIGLGAASLARFVHHHLPHAKIRVVEIAPAVVAAARPGVQNLSKNTIPEANRLVRDLRSSPPHPLVVNTHSSAMLAAMAARLVPGLGSRTSLFVHDFQWRSLDHIFSRLAGARILVPHRVVLDRLGYLNPWYLPDADAGQPVRFEVQLIGVL